MAKYNLIKNGSFRSVTTSGSYNKDLSNVELASLQDGNTTSSGVLLKPSDYLCLEVDLNQRIKVDGIFLYANDLTKQSNIAFQFKNYEEEDFSGATKTVTTTYNAILPEPSAPRCIRCTISGVDLNIFEFKVLNDDYIIEFGNDGNENDTWLDHTPVGSFGTPQAIEIYNNTDDSGIPANAYVCVDSTGSGRDDYLKISKNKEGPYLGFKDGAIVGHKWSDWNTGVFNNTYNENSDNTVRLTDVGSLFVQTINKITNLPLLNCSYLSVPFGVRHPWDYAEDRHKIYAVFYTAQASTSYAVSLYEYDLSTNVWSFISTITFPWVLNADRFSMAYDDHYIYFRGMLDTNTWLRIFRYDLDGSPGNLELLSGHGGNPNRDPNPVMCSNKSGILYEYAGDYTYSGGRHLYKYTVATDTWTALNGDLYANASNTVQNQLVYDKERNVLYHIYINYSSTWNWVQRYDISLNVWNHNFFDYGSRIGNGFPYIDISYYNNKIYFFSANYETKCYTYDVVTDEVDSIDLEFFYNHSDMVYGMATSPTVSGVGEVSIYSTNVKTTATDFCGVNTGYESSEEVIIIQGGVGTYTTSIISFDNPFKASYFVVEAETEAGKTNVSKDEDIYNGIIEVRSSTNEPAYIDEIYWPTSESQYDYIDRYTVGTDVYDRKWLNTSTSHYFPKITSCDRRSGRIFNATYNTSDDSNIKIYSRSGNQLYSVSHINNYDTVHLNQGAFFDTSKGVWLYYKDGNFFRHLKYDLTTLSTKYTYNMYDFCAELNADGLWYVEQDLNSLVNIDSNSSVKKTINLYDPQGLCGIEDNGCWVIDLNDPVYGKIIKRYSDLGDLLQIIQVEKSVYRMTHDHKSGFYVRTGASDGEIWHYTDKGVRDMVITGIFDEEYLRGGRHGVVLYSESHKRIRYIDLASKSVVFTKYYSDFFEGSWDNVGIPDIFSYDLEAEDLFREDYGSGLLPVSYDTTWYGDSNLEWKEVPKDGYFLPKCKYHQARITLRNYDGESTPIIKSISMAPAEQITDIQPKTSKPIYVRSDIPATSEVSKFDTRIKVWWDVEET